MIISLYEVNLPRIIWPTTGGWLRQQQLSFQRTVQFFNQLCPGVELIGDIISGGEDVLLLILPLQRWRPNIEVKPTIVG